MSLSVPGTIFNGDQPASHAQPPRSTAPPHRPAPLPRPTAPRNREHAQKPRIAEAISESTPPEVAPRKAWPVPDGCMRPVVMLLDERETKLASSSSILMGCLREAFDVTAWSDGTTTAAGSDAAFASREDSLEKSNLRARASVQARRGCGSGGHRNKDAT